MLRLEALAGKGHGVSALVRESGVGTLSGPGLRASSWPPATVRIAPPEGAHETSMCHRWDRFVPPGDAFVESTGYGAQLAG